MFSVIICSPNNDRFQAVSSNLALLLVNDPYEIIRIADARSLAEGYARAVARSRGDILVFCHDDIEILSADFADRLKQHMERFDLVGVAGTSRLIRGEWVAAGPPFIFGQVTQPHRQGGYVVRIFGVPSRAVAGIQAIDGLFFAARRRVIDTVPFDASTFDGFNHYDLDFSFAAHLAGFQVAVANDLHVVHWSWGSMDQTLQYYAGRFQHKYGQHLHPMTPRTFTFAWVHVPTKEDALEVMRDNVDQASRSK